MKLPESFYQSLDHDMVLAWEVCQLFCHSVPEKLKDISIFMENQDFDAAFSAIHTLKGNFGYLGLEPELSLSLQLEQEILQGAAANSRTSLSCLQNQVTALIEAMISDGLYVREHSA